MNYCTAYAHKTFINIDIMLNNYEWINLKELLVENEGHTTDLIHSCFFSGIMVLKVSCDSQGKFTSKLLSVKTWNPNSAGSPSIWIKKITMPNLGILLCAHNVQPILTHKWSPCTYLYKHSIYQQWSQIRICWQSDLQVWHWHANQLCHLAQECPKTLHCSRVSHPRGDRPSKVCTATNGYLESTFMWLVQPDQQLQFFQGKKMENGTYN